MTIPLAAPFTVNGLMTGLGIAVSAIGVTTALTRFGMWVADVNTDRAQSKRALARIGRALRRRNRPSGRTSGASPDDTDDEQEGR